MRIIKNVAAVAGAAEMLLAGLGATAAAPASAATTHPVASASGLPVAYTGGWGPARIHPGRIGFQDAGLAHLRWSQWSSTTAHGTGRFATGVPGHTVDAVRVTLSNVKATHKGPDTSPR